MPVLVAPREQAIVDELETYFKRYPDIPVEVIVKESMLNVGQRFTEAALERAAGSMVKSYRLFSYDLTPMAELGTRVSRTVPEWFVIRGGPFQLRPVYVQTRLFTDAPYVIDVVDDRLVVLADGQIIAEVDYPPAPAYYSKYFPDGTAYRDIIAYSYFITIFRSCQYWGPKEECRFCDINENARQMKQSKAFTLNAPVKPVDKIVEVADDITRELTARLGYTPALRFMYSGGTILKSLHGKTEDDFYMEYVEALKWGGPRRYIILQTNAKDRETMKRYRAYGVDNHNANLEVWDRRLFEWLNPGKGKRVPWETWVKWMVDSVDVFGEGNVTPNLVCGIEMAQPYGFKTVEEAVASTSEGLEFLMSHGVMPRMNHWCPEPGSYVVKHYDQPQIPLDFYMQIFQKRYELWKKYHLPMPYEGFTDFLQYDRRPKGRFHGAYDDLIFFKELPDSPLAPTDGTARSA